jgi:L-rhamnose mutarotase
MGLCNRLRPEKAEEYEALHAVAWPGVLATITSCSIRNFSIFLRTPENLLFAYWEYHGDDFAADMRKMTADPITRQCGRSPTRAGSPSKRGMSVSGGHEIFHRD